MAAPKNHPKWGGRKKGTPNKDSLSLQQKADEMGVDPFEILLHYASGNQTALNELEPISPITRAKAAAEACQYLHPKRKAIEHSGAISMPKEVEAAAAWLSTATTEEIEAFIKDQKKEK